MNCQELARKIEDLEPGADPVDVARVCLLVANSVECLSDLEDEAALVEAWSSVRLRLHGATDQHAAMTAELEELAVSDPRKFSAEQIWVLIRAIKVQSQVLQLYLGEEALNV
jgi:hypothetical protein